MPYVCSRPAAALLTATLAFLSGVAFVYAQKAGLVPCKGADCNWCSLIQLVQNIINYAVYLGVLIGAIVFAYAGWTLMAMHSQYVGGYSGEGIEQAKKMLWGVVIGIVCILGGWLVVDTLMKALVSEGQGFGGWNQIQCTLTDTTEGGRILPTSPAASKDTRPRRPTDDIYR